MFSTVSNRFKCFNSFQPLATGFNHFQLFSTIFNRFQPLSTVFNHFALVLLSAHSKRFSVSTGPIQSKSCNVRPSMSDSVFLGLSLALRSHDQFPALSLVSPLPPSLPPPNHPRIFFVFPPPKFFSPSFLWLIGDMR